MRTLLALFACMMLVMTTWSGIAQAAGPACSEMADQVTVQGPGHGAGNCDEMPADADRNYPHCHTGCHGHQVATPVPSRGPVPAVDPDRAYEPVRQATLSAHQVDQDLRPPQV